MKEIYLKQNYYFEKLCELDNAINNFEDYTTFETYNELYLKRNEMRKAYNFFRNLYGALRRIKNGRN